LVITEYVLNVFAPFIFSLHDYRAFPFVCLNVNVHTAYESALC